MEDQNNKWLALLGAGVAGVGIGVGAASELFLRKTLYRPAEASQQIADEFGDPQKMAGYMEHLSAARGRLEERGLEDVYTTSRDGLRLHALYLAPKPDLASGQIAILHHGFTGNAMDNAMQAEFLYDMGFGVLLLDLRAHGKSEGDYVGFGILDRYDTLSWVRHVRERFGGEVKIVLFGVSMGAATVLMSLGLAEVREQVSAAIADCGFTAPSEVFANVIRKDYHLPPGPIIGLGNLRSKAIAGYRFDEYSTLEALRDNHVPLLLIHGKEDVFVPVQMSEQNYAACAGPKELLLVDRAGHAASIFEDAERYRGTMEAFLRRYGDGSGLNSNENQTGQ